MLTINTSKIAIFETENAKVLPFTLLRKWPFLRKILRVSLHFFEKNYNFFDSNVKALIITFLRKMPTFEKNIEGPAFIVTLLKLCLDFVHS